MTVNFFGASLDISILLVTFLAISILWLYPKFPRSRTESPYRFALSAFVVIHTLLILRTAIVDPPPNIFKRLNIPLTTPTQVIRAALVRDVYPGREFESNDGLDIMLPLTAPLEALLARLASFELRTLYVRFGHTVVQDCDYCRTFGEFALFAVPTALLSYIREAAVVGLVTIRGTRRERLRVMGIGLLVGAAAMEGYWISTAHITLPQKNGEAVIMWHDLIWNFRQALFLLLPLVLHFLPPSPPFAENPLSAVSSSIRLDSMLKKIHLLKFTRGAVMRTPELRNRAAKWWEEERREGEWVRSDEGVRNMAEKLGEGFQKGNEGSGDGKLRSNAVTAVGILSKEFTPSEFWEPSSS